MLTAGELYELIETARQDYKGYKVHLPEQYYDRAAYDMHPSEIGLCDLKSALTAARVNADYNVRNDWLLDHGNYVAPMIQEPLMLYAMKNSSIAFHPEAILVGNGEYDGYSTQVYQGKADGLLTVDGVQYILEIKDTEGQIKRSVGEPSLRYAMQLLAYKLLAGANHNPAFIITCSKWGHSVYELRWVGNGFMVYDQWGNIYQEPAWANDWNNPSVLNYVEVIRKINKKQALIDLAKVARERWKSSEIDLLVQQAKVADPLNDREQGWLCMWHYDKPKSAKARGEARPNCEFAQRCHGFQNQVHVTKKADGGGYEFEVGF